MTVFEEILNDETKFRKMLELADPLVFAQYELAEKGAALAWEIYNAAPSDHSRERLQQANAEFEEASTNALHAIAASKVSPPRNENKKTEVSGYVYRRPQLTPQNEDDNGDDDDNNNDESIIKLPSPIEQATAEVASLFEQTNPAQIAVNATDEQVNIGSPPQKISAGSLEEVKAELDKLSSLSLTDLQLDSEIRNDCLAIALVMSNKVVAPAEIAKQTGLSLFRVLSLLRNGEFERVAKTIDKQFSDADNPEARELKQIARSINQIITERAILATTHEELSDTQMLALGLNPLMRNVDMALTPGGSTGLIKEEVVTIRKAIGAKSRMTTEKVFTPDYEMIRLKMQIAARLTELESSGKAGETVHANVYVRRKEI